MCSNHFLLFFQVSLWRSSISSSVVGLPLGKFWDLSWSSCFFFFRRITPPTEEYTHTDLATSTRTTDFLIREPSCRTTISKYLKSSNVRTEDRRHLVQIITNSFPVNVFTIKFKKYTSNRCDIYRHMLKERGETMTEATLPFQIVIHITGYCLGQRDSITTAHHTTWKTLQSGIVKAAPKGWNFPSVNGELTIGHLWKDHKMDDSCVIYCHSTNFIVQVKRLCNLLYCLVDTCGQFRCM